MVKSYCYRQGLIYIYIYTSTWYKRQIPEALFRMSPLGSDVFLQGLFLYYYYYLVVGWLAASRASPASLAAGLLLALIARQVGVAGGWFKLGKV